ncbi:MAG TPA: hypothetical protein VH558_00360 [Pseudolabrys sp.]|jgi:hypothetical protein
MLPQRRRTGNGAPMYFANRVVVWMTVHMATALRNHVGDIPRLKALLASARSRHAESILTRPHAIRSSIVNAVQGYSKVYPILDTTFKRYEFMRSSA